MMKEKYNIPATWVVEITYTDNVLQLGSPSDKVVDGPTLVGTNPGDADEPEGFSRRPNNFWDVEK